MSERPENPFQPRLGRMRSHGSAKRARTFMSRVSKSMSRAGPPSSRGRRQRGRRGKQHSRRVIIKARFVRLSMSSPKALSEHLRYISRDVAMKTEERGRVFNGQSEDVDREVFAEAAMDDRHHFRIIVSPEDGAELADMKPFIKDLVAGMETDLGTRLDWVAAVHHNTDHPHAHIVIRGKRDDDRDLVMPRAYIAQGIRERAEELLTLELGPQTQLERDVKLARQTGAERVTEIDRSLARMAGDKGRLDLSAAPYRYRIVNTARLRTLQKLGLAEQVKGTKWALSNGFENTLKELGERGDIIRQIHKGLGEKTGRVVDPSRPFADELMQPVTGAILRTGLRGEGHDEPFLVLDTSNGRAITAKIAAPEGLGDLKPGMIITLSPPDISPRPSDHVIADIAAANGGVYSAAFHQSADPMARPEYIQAHVRRLEALRRVGIGERSQDGAWRLPPDYLASVTRQHLLMAERQGPTVQIESWAGIQDQVHAAGLTWLDEHPAPEAPAYGFGADIKDAKERRNVTLLERGLIKSADSKLDPLARERLQRSGRDALGRELSVQLGKPYLPVPENGQIQGIYLKSITRPDGKFAVIDRERNFTIAPWRKTLEQSRGRTIAATIRNQKISWSIGRNKGRSL